jgi:hypothetical protein
VTTTIFKPLMTEYVNPPKELVDLVVDLFDSDIKDVSLVLESQDWKYTGWILRVDGYTLFAAPDQSGDTDVSVYNRTKSLKRVDFDAFLEDVRSHKRINLPKTFLDFVRACSENGIAVKTDPSRITKDIYSPVRSIHADYSDYINFHVDRSITNHLFSLNLYGDGIEYCSYLNSETSIIQPDPSEMVGLVQALPTQRVSLTEYEDDEEYKDPSLSGWHWTKADESGMVES